MIEDPGEKIGSTDPAVRALTLAGCFMILTVLAGALVADSVRTGGLPKAWLLATMALWVAAGIASHSLAFWFGWAQRDDEAREARERLAALRGAPDARRYATRTEVLEAAAHLATEADVRSMDSHEVRWRAIAVLREAVRWIEDGRVAWDKVGEANHAGIVVGSGFAILYRDARARGWLHEIPPGKREQVDRAVTACMVRIEEER